MFFYSKLSGFWSALSYVGMYQLFIVLKDIVAPKTFPISCFQPFRRSLSSATTDEQQAIGGLGRSTAFF
jgi:hypothetical protein